MDSASSLSGQEIPTASHNSSLRNLIRIFARVLVATVLLYLLSRFLIYWHDWPPLITTFQSFMGGEELESSRLYKGIALIMIYVSVFVLISFSIKRTPERSLSDDANSYKDLSYFIVRAAFWSVFLVGLTDAIISFMRVEDILVSVVGAEIAQILDPEKELNQ